MKEKVFANDVDFSSYPKNVKLKYGEDENREWYEWRKRKNAIVIQRLKSEPYWYVFFLQGDKARIVKVELTKEERKTIVDKIFGGKLEECLEALRKLGFEPELEVEKKKKKSKSAPGVRR